MVEAWIEKAVIAIVGLLVTWGTWLTARSFNSLSRREHERLCEARQKAVDAKLDRLEEKQDETLSLLISVIRDKHE
jgi:CHASE1-domain containing sensor protein